MAVNGRDRAEALATLAEDVSEVYADVGPATAQAWVVAAVDALAHALVDLADGRACFTRHTPVRALPLLEAGSPDAADRHVDRASCAAAAGRLRRVEYATRRVLGGPGGVPRGAGADTLRALSLVAGALEDLAAEPATRAPTSAVRASALRAVRTAYRLVQPERPAAPSPSGPGG